MPNQFPGPAHSNGCVQVHGYGMGRGGEEGAEAGQEYLKPALQLAAVWPVAFIFFNATCEPVHVS